MFWVRWCSVRKIMVVIKIKTRYEDQPIQSTSKNTSKSENTSWSTLSSKWESLWKEEVRNRKLCFKDYAYRKADLFISKVSTTSWWLTGHTPATTFRTRWDHELELTVFLLSFRFLRDEHHKGKSAVPETQGTEEGSAKRNIARKHDHDPNRYVFCLGIFFHRR
jgi:hypothetical protein